MHPTPQDHRASAVLAQSLCTINNQFVGNGDIPKKLLRHLLRCLTKFPTEYLTRPRAAVALRSFRGLAFFLQLLGSYCGNDASLLDAEVLCRYLLTLWR
jgi:hypothetical protein